MNKFYSLAKIFNMKSNFLLFLFVMLALHIDAQTTGQIANYTSNGNAGYSSMGQLNTVLGSIKEAKDKLTYNNSNIQGSPYTDNTFRQANLYYGDDNLGQMYYRYNAYNEEIEIKKSILPEEKPRALARDKKIALFIDNNPMSFLTFIDKNNLTQNGYLTKLEDGKFTLYRRTDVKFTEGQKSQNSFVKATPARFTQFVEYYLKKEGVDRIDEVLLKKNKILKLVEGNNKDMLKKYLKEKSINVKNELDLIKVIQYINTLQ